MTSNEYSDGLRMLVHVVTGVGVLVLFMLILALYIGGSMDSGNSAKLAKGGNGEEIAAALTEDSGGEEAAVALNEDSADEVAAVNLARTPLEAVESTEQGKLVNPYDPADPVIAEEGHRIYMETGCNGCHGGTGGGGMGPPLSNQRWVYGKEPDTLFRLITLGTIELQAAGYSRIATEKVKAPMLPQASGPIVIIDSEERLWKIITWILSLHVDKES